MVQLKQRDQKIQQFVRLLETQGPNIDAIAKTIGVHEETVRYWYQKRLLARGYTVQTVVDYGKLGLRRLIVYADVAQPYLTISANVFREMASRGYLSYYASTIPTGSYILAPLVPNECIDAYMGFLQELKSKGFFSDLSEVLQFDWWRNMPMKGEDYDFKSHTWEVDLIPKMSGRISMISTAERCEFDRTDLQILEQLQPDSNKRMNDIARAIGISQSGVLRHSKHILDRKLVKMYRLNWAGTGMGSRRQKPLTSKHRYLNLTISVRDVKKDELQGLLLALHRLPFLWAEGGGRNYICELFIPLDLVNDVLTFLTGAIRPFRKRAVVLIENQNDAFSSGITPELYDQKTKRWTFDSAAALDRVDKLLVSVKEPR